MRKLLFEEGTNKGTEYRKDSLAVQIMLASFAVVFTVLLVVCLLLKEYFVAIIPGACILGMVLALTFTAFQKVQFLQVYEDKIVYRKTLAFKAKEILMPPALYTIDIAYTLPTTGYSVKFIFKNQHGEKILTYRAVSLMPSARGENQNRWEEDIFAVGCEVNDKHDIVRNK